jgi:hypothetical protein
MSGDEEFGDLFDASILESLEGALNDISLQMESADEDNVVESDALGDIALSDNDEDTDDDAYTCGTYDTGDYTSEEEDDPESGENELFAMMDSLVAELEMEMVDLEKMSDEPTTVVEEEKIVNPNESVPEPSVSFQAPVMADSSTSQEKVLPSVQDRRNLGRAKSLLKVLSGLAEEGQEKNPEGKDLDATPRVANQKPAIDPYTSPKRDGARTVQYEKITSPSAEDPDYVPILDYTKKDQSSSHTTGKIPYVPTKEDFNQLVGVLANFSKRKRRGQQEDQRQQTDLANQEIPDLESTAPDTQFDKIQKITSDDLDFVPVSDYSPKRKVRPPRPLQKESVVSELSLPENKSLSLTEGERKKTGRAISNYTMKFRRQYMIRKSQQQAEAASGKNAAATDTDATITKTTTDTSLQRSSEAKTPERKQKNDNHRTPSTETPSGAGRTPAPKKKKKKRRKRTNKHRKGKPKKIDDDELQKYPSHAPSGSIPNGIFVDTTEYQTRDEVIHALSQTEIWNWLVNQVRVGPYN